MRIMLLKRRVSPIPKPIIAAKITRNNDSRSMLERLFNSPAARAIGAILMVEANVLMALDRTGSTFLRASAESTVERAQAMAVMIARASPSIVSALY